MSGAAVATAVPDAAARCSDAAARRCSARRSRRVNDTLGHATGTRSWCARPNACAGAMRAGDTVACLGGDEFAVLLEDESNPLASAARITEALRAPFDLNGRRIDVAVSIGVVELARTHEPADADELLARADTGMYAAKRSGKGRIVAHRPGMTLSELEDQGTPRSATSTTSS